MHDPMIRSLLGSGMLAWLVIGATLAADAAAGWQAESRSIAAEDLRLQSLAGEAIPFAESLGPDGRAVCFAFLHPACPLAQEYGPVLDALAQQFAAEGIRRAAISSRPISIHSTASS